VSHGARFVPGDSRSSAVAPVAVTLPHALVRLFAGSVPRVELSAATIAEMMDVLDARWPGMRDRLCDSTPSIRRHINVFVDGERANLKTRLAPGAAVLVTTAMSGG